MLGLCVGLALPAGAIVPALQKFPVEGGMEVTVWTTQVLPDGKLRWEGRVPGAAEEYRLDVRCAPSAVELSLTDASGASAVHYSLVRPGPEWKEATPEGTASSVSASPEIQRLATAQHSAMCLPRVYPNAPQAPQV